MPRILSSVFYSVVLSCAILYYVMINSKKVAYIFAFFEGAINLYYFTLFLMIQNKLYGLIIAIPISIIIPFTIYNYANAITNTVLKIPDDIRERIKKEAKVEILEELEQIGNKDENMEDGKKK